MAEPAARGGNNLTLPLQLSQTNVLTLYWQSQAEAIARRKQLANGRGWMQLEQEKEKLKEAAAPTKKKNPAIQ